MMYPTKAVFFPVVTSENAYGELVPTVDANTSFSTGVRTGTVSFKDKLQGNIEISGEQLYLYTRKNTNTLSVSEGDRVTLPGVSSRTYKIEGIDHKHEQRAEIVFFVDAVEE